MAALPVGLVAEQFQAVQTIQPSPAEDLDLPELGRACIATPPAQLALSRDTPRAERGVELGYLARCHASPHQRRRKREHDSREAVAAEVAGLPHAARCERLEALPNRKTELAAATITGSVTTHEPQWGLDLAQHRQRTRPSQIAQARQRIEIELPPPHTPPFEPRSSVDDKQPSP